MGEAKEPITQDTVVGKQFNVKLKGANGVAVTVDEISIFLGGLFPEVQQAILGYAELKDRCVKYAERLEREIQKQDRLAERERFLEETLSRVDPYNSFIWKEALKPVVPEKGE